MIEEYLEMSKANKRCEEFAVKQQQYNRINTSRISSNQNEYERSKNNPPLTVTTTTSQTKP